MCVLVLFLIICVIVLFFFKQKTAYEMRISDWSSDVCSSDLIGVLNAPARGEHWEAVLGGGARRNGIALSVSAHSELAGARIPSDKLAARNAHLTAVHRPNGIALQMAMVAADEADMAAALRWGAEWAT